MKRVEWPRVEWRGCLALPVAPLLEGQPRLPTSLGSTGGSQLAHPVASSGPRGEGGCKWLARDPAGAAAAGALATPVYAPVPTHSHSSHCVEQVFQQLTSRYARAAPRVRAIQAAVCPDGAAQIVLWTVDTSSATGNFGSNDSDARCLTRPRAYGSWVTEIASLSRRHLEHHQHYLGYNKDECSRCSAYLARPLPSHKCMENVISKNLRPLTVPCYHLSDLPTMLDRASPTLVVIDAEGSDVDVLRKMPLAADVAPARIIFESKHLLSGVFEEAAALLFDHGYELVGGAFHASTSTWHHVNATR